ncbi:MAG: uracil-DNA glycosylase [Clostridia bacterium]|nr:uracil-DNA glycosylase [Clostridia bacterium]
MTDQLAAFEKRCQAFFKSLWPGEEKVLVFGRGLSAQPKLMLIGEAPGEQEVLQGQPFVGKAGKNLTAFLQGVGLEREEIYITNAVKIRPTRLSPAGRMVNRPPTREEIGLFHPYLMEEIALVKPRRIVTLGNVALKALCGDKVLIGQCHGRDTLCQVMAPKGQMEQLPLFPLYHPASVIYNPGLKAVYEADLAALWRILEQEASI